MRRNKTFIVGSILAFFLAAGCSGGKTENQMEKDIDALNKAIARKDSEIESIKVRLAGQDELIGKQKEDLEKTFGILKEDLAGLEAEMGSFKSGEMVSLKTDLDILKKTVEALRTKLQKMDSGLSQL